MGYSSLASQRMEVIHAIFAFHVVMMVKNFYSSLRHFPHSVMFSIPHFLLICVPASTDSLQAAFLSHPRAVKQGRHLAPLCVAASPCSPQGKHPSAAVSYR